MNGSSKHDSCFTFLNVPLSRPGFTRGFNILNLKTLKSKRINTRSCSSAKELTVSARFSGVHEPSSYSTRCSFTSTLRFRPSFGSFYRRYTFEMKGEDVSIRAFGKNANMSEPNSFFFDPSPFSVLFLFSWLLRVL